MEISRRWSDRAEIPPFRAMQVLARAAALEAEGRRIAHLEVGQPAGGAPTHARAAAQAALSTPLGYTIATGTTSLRERIADWTRARYGVVVDPARIIVTTGSSAAFQLAFLALFAPGARLALGDPGYPAYRAIAAALGLSVARIETTPQDDWTVTPETLRAEVAAHGPVAGLLLASPANPTGATLDRPRLEAIMAACADAGAWFISDEIYHGLEYGAPAPSALALSDDAIVINSFSKYFRMTGWRVGWMIVPADLVPAFERLAQNLFICPPHPAQVAAAAAFDDVPELDADRARYARNRDVLSGALARLGFGHVAPPAGAFYLYADVSAHLRPGEDSLGWCAALLEEAGVASTPGVDFDPVRGRRTVRFSFCGAAEEIDAAIAAMEGWLARRSGVPAD